MRDVMSRLTTLPGRAGRYLKLLRDDPERFGRNLLQVTNSSLFEERLVDVMHAVPMHVRFDQGGFSPLRLNVLDAAWTTSGMTGGPNTVINLACRIAREGIAVRLVATVEPSTINPDWLRRHARSLVGGHQPDIEIVSAVEGCPLELGPRDMFLATHWTTAQQLGPVLERLPIKQFFYMLQEFEPGFYGWSSNYARAIETYGMDFWPIINEAMLADYLFSQPLGRLARPETRRRAVIFEPAVDDTLFHPGSAKAPVRPNRLLFYARPTNTRNMFGLGLLALRQIASDPAFAGWEFLSIGSRASVPDLPLGHGRMLKRAPWLDYAGYADLLRAADVLLCPMLSPHTSYPVLEMAACGGISVTNTFMTKTKAGLEALSERIIAVDPTVDGLSEGVLRAVRIVKAGGVRAASLNTARNWGVALDPPARRVAQIMRDLAADRCVVDIAASV